MTGQQLLIALQRTAKHGHAIFLRLDRRTISITAEDAIQRVSGSALYRGGGSKHRVRTLQLIDTRPPAPWQHCIRTTTGMSPWPGWDKCYESAPTKRISVVPTPQTVS